MAAVAARGLVHAAHRALVITARGSRPAALPRCVAARAAAASPARLPPSPPLPPVVSATSFSSSAVHHRRQLRQHQQRRQLSVITPHAASSSGGSRATVDAPDEDEEEDEDDEEAEGAWDPSDMPFLVGARGGSGDEGGSATEVSVDVLLVEENGGVRSCDSDGMDPETLAARLEDDAGRLVGWLLDPPPGSGLPAGVFPSAVSYAELSVALCSDDYIQSLNAEWRGKDAPTDVLSFPQDAFGDLLILGDCVISVDTARRQAREVGHGLLDECRVLLVHGLLHLMGFDHEAGEEDAAEMAAYEDSLLALLLGDQGGGGGGSGSGGGSGGRTGLVSSSLSGTRTYELGFTPSGAGDHSKSSGKETDGGNEGLDIGAATGTPSAASAAAADWLRGAELASSGQLDTSIAAAASAASIVLPTVGGGSTRKAADCLVLDLDGTLLNSECIITPRTAEALRDAMAAGVTVFIATGKARPAAIRAAATAHLDGAGGIVSNGHPGVFLQGLDVYGRGGTGLYRAEMPRDVVEEAFAAIYSAGLTNNSMALTAFCGDKCATLATHPLLDELSERYHEPRSVVWADVHALLCAAAASYGTGGGGHGTASSSGVQKLLLMGGSSAEIDRMRPLWEAAFESRAEVTQAVATMLEVLPRGNGKARGVSTLLTHLAVDTARVVAVGDGENDMDMLRLVGCGVAMRNAGKALQDIVDHVLDRTNDEDGVAEAIQRFVLC